MDLSLNSLFLEAKYGTSKVNSILQQYVDKGCFIQFSDIEKLGINPRSEFNTPLGIYAYPLTNDIYRQFRQNSIPFASDRKYIILFKPENLNIVSVDSKGNSDWGLEDTNEFFENPQLEETIKSKILDERNILKIFERTKLDYSIEANSLSDSFFDWCNDRHFDLDTDEKTTVHYFKRFSAENFESVLDFYIKTGSRESKFKTPFGQLWNITRLLGNGLVGWRKILVGGGIDGVVDLGKGLIHPSERTQGVFFSMKGLKLIEIFDNPISSNKHTIKDKAEENKSNFKLISKFNNNPLSLNSQELRNMHQLVLVNAKDGRRWGDPYPYSDSKPQESKQIITPETSKKLNKAFMYVTGQINQSRKRNEEFIKEILRNLGDHGVYLNHYLNSEKMRMEGDLTFEYQRELIEDYLTRKQLYNQAHETTYMIYNFLDKYPEDNLINLREKQMYLKRIIDANYSAAGDSNVKFKNPPKPIKQTYPNQKMMDFLSPHY